MAATNRQENSRYHKQHYSVMLKTGRKSQVKQDNQNWVGSKFFFAKQKKVWLSTIFWWKSRFFLAWQWQTSRISPT